MGLHQYGSLVLGSGSPRGVQGAVSGAGCPPRSKHMVSIHQSLETQKSDAGRALARAQLCCSGAGALCRSDEISGCGQDSSAPAGAVWWLDLWWCYCQDHGVVPATAMQPPPSLAWVGWDWLGLPHSVVGPKLGGSSEEQAPHLPPVLCRREAPPSQRLGGRAGCLPGQRVWEGVSTP